MTDYKREIVAASARIEATVHEMKLLLVAERKRCRRLETRLGVALSLVPADKVVTYHARLYALGIGAYDAPATSPVPNDSTRPA